MRKRENGGSLYWLRGVDNLRGIMVFSRVGFALCRGLERAFQ
jgi:hypothetical protein